MSGRKWRNYFRLASFYILQVTSAGLEKCTVIRMTQAAHSSEPTDGTSIVIANTIT